ncbi:hypothetical protein HCA44_14005 [Rhodococcus sp. HNM0569]|nr:hypothetical protein [Rhodococcus sp. HNM0569]NLU83890.1 hypothetical protein [Rhodococcus sp. HNM0569]
MVVRSVRALSGAVAAGTVVLACVAVGAAFVGTREGFPGPGSTTVAAHVVAAVVAVAAQWWTDRRFGAQALLGSLVVFVSLGTLVWTQWWG